jgi:DNA polymerase III subunit alpha, Gram-positive type
MTKSFLDIIDRLNFPTFEREFFLESSCTSPVVDLSERVVRLAVTLKRALPFSLYQKLKTRLADALDSEIELSINALTVDLEPSDTLSYLRLALEALLSPDEIKHVLSTVEGSTIVFLVDDSQWLVVLTQQLDQLSTHLERCGLSFTLQVKVQENSPLAIIDDVQVESPRKVEKTPTPYRRKNGDDLPLSAIEALYEGQRDVKIRGRIFNIDSQMIKSNTVQRLSVYLNDETDAISFTVFIERDDEKAKFGTLKVGDHVQLSGDVKSDAKSELVFSVRNLERIDDWRFVDDLASQKRVELHAHTKMSEMDGVADIEDYLEKAFKWGHDAFAVTDHYSVQAFPKAQHKVKSLLKQYPNRKFKMIYGCEMSLNEAELIAVHNPKNQALLDTEYVLFDLETSGLSTRFDRIIEFGAVKIKSGMILDRMQMFVQAPVKLSPFIIEKTNIKQSDVDQALPEETHLDAWMRFFGDAVLVAHNATFDVGFINAALERANRPPLTNTVIDTLPLAKLLIDDKRSYRLGAIAKHYKIPYDDVTAHRADYDAEVLMGLFQRMMDHAHQRGCLVLEDLNALNTVQSFKKDQASHVIVLAKNADGLKALFDLVSLAHTQRIVSENKSEESGAEPRLLRSDLASHRQHLLLGSACLNGELFELAANRSQAELEAAMSFYDYVEIQPLPNYQPLLSNGSVPSPERLKMILKTLVETAKSLKIPVVATGDAHYLNPWDKVFRDIYINSKGTGKTRHPLYIYNTERRQSTSSPDQHFRSTDEMMNQFAFLGAETAYELVVLNTNLIANRIEQVYPIKTDLYTPTIDHAEDNLKAIVEQSATAIYGNPLPEIVQERISKELTSITTHGFAVIYYTAHLLVKKSLDDGYIVGSRGSVGSSLVATLANITEVNPLPPHYVCPSCQHSEFFTDGSVNSGYDLGNKLCPHCSTRMRADGQDIPFETFLGFEGDKVPDIDLNFSSEYQEVAHAYTKVLFGEKQVYRAGTISTVADKTAFGYVKGYMEEKGIITPYSNAYRTYLAKGCEGVKRTSGQHPGGIIVIPQTMDVHDFTPVQYPANKVNAEWLTTHFEFGDIHDNVLKLDILGHVDPSAMRMLERITGVNVQSIPMNDASALSLFNSPLAMHVDDQYDEQTGAVGLPEFGTGFVRQILASTRPSKFSDLVRISGLSHGTDVWLNNAKNLIERDNIAFEDVIGCRDDIMLYLIHKGLPSKQAFEIMEAIRKGRGLKEEQKTLLGKFNVPAWYVESCQRIKYLFPKAHAVAYVLMAVRVAWFKVHYPLQYYAAFFTLRCSAYEYETMISPLRVIRSRLKGIQAKLNDPMLKREVSSKDNDLVPTLEVIYEMNSRGLRMAPLDLNLSQATEFILHPSLPDAILPPFIILDGLGENVAKSIVEARSTRAFFSKEDVQKRSLINSTQLSKFEELGLLSALDDNNQMSLF